MPVPNRFGDLRLFAHLFPPPSGENGAFMQAWVNKFAQTLAARYPDEPWGIVPGTCLLACGDEIVSVRNTMGDLRWDDDVHKGLPVVRVVHHDWMLPPEAHVPAPPDTAKLNQLIAEVADLRAHCNKLTDAIVRLTLMTPPDMAKASAQAEHAAALVRAVADIKAHIDDAHPPVVGFWARLFR